MPFDSTPVEVPVAPRTKEAMILDAAIELIETRGWTQGDFQNQHGFCVIGAIRQSAVNHQGFTSANPFGAYARVLRKVTMAIGWPVFGWNDDKNRTKADVLAVLRRVRSEF